MFCKSILLLIFPALLTSCGSIRSRSSAEWPWADNKFCAAATCTTEEARMIFGQASQFCRQVHNFYERGAGRAGTFQWVLGTAGTVAGAVIAPIAHGSAQAAWAGFSGATNALQLSADNAFSAALELKRQGAVAQAAIDGSALFASANNPDAQVVAGIQTANRCWMAAARADQAALEAVGAPTPPAMPTNVEKK